MACGLPMTLRHRMLLSALLCLARLTRADYALAAKAPGTVPVIGKSIASVRQARTDRLMRQAVKPNSRNALLFESWLIRHARARECVTNASGSADPSQQEGCGESRDDASSLGAVLSRLVHTASRAGRGRRWHRGRRCESGGRRQSQSARRSVCSGCSTARVIRLCSAPRTHALYCTAPSSSDPQRDGDHRARGRGAGGDASRLPERASP